jgi:hypothetical protein
LTAAPSIALIEYSRIIATFSISGRNFTVGSNVMGSMIYIKKMKYIYVQPNRKPK